MAGANYKPSHVRPKVSVGGYTVESNISRNANIPSHKNLVSQGFRL